MQFCATFMIPEERPWRSLFSGRAVLENWHRTVFLVTTLLRHLLRRLSFMCSSYWLIAWRHVLRGKKEPQPRVTRRSSVLSSFPPARFYHVHLFILLRFLFTVFFSFILFSASLFISPRLYSSSVSASRFFFLFRNCFNGAFGASFYYFFFLLATLLFPALLHRS